MKSIYPEDLRSSVLARLVFLFFLSLVFSFPLFAQTFELHKGDTVNYTDTDGLRQGKWLITNMTKKLPEYEPDQLIEEAFFVDGKKEGIRKQYFPNGRLKSEVTFQNNVPKGYSKMYYANGNISEEGIWKNGGWDGSYKYYYEDGKLCYDWYYMDGRRDGEQKYYFPNGKLNYIGIWKEGNEAGLLKEYNETGLLVAEKNYNAGKLDESATKYYPAGITEKKVEEKNEGIGTLNGFYKLKSKDGRVSKEGTFINGQLMDGKSFQYDSDGKLQRTIIMKDGKTFQTIEEK